MQDPIVYIVHCVDTEGPLYESINATFNRLKEIFNLDLKPSKKLLEDLQKGKINLNGLEKAVQKVVNPKILNYNDSWEKMDLMLNEALSNNFRNKLTDSFDNGWIYNWFCVDHIDYKHNPRKREIGYHKIFDHYNNILKKTNSDQDDIQFHYHPHAFTKDATLTATHWWIASNTLYEVLNRRIIDRNWFPSVNRPGFHVTRPDSHWFLEQFIPFDYPNQAYDSEKDDEKQNLTPGRWGDWRRAPKSWKPYHPSYDDYQTPGDCKRWIARCLNVGTRMNLLNEKEVKIAFEEAEKGNPSILAFTNHDFRDIRLDVEDVRLILSKVAKQFPNVKFKFSRAIDAMRNALSLPKQKKCIFDIKLEQLKNDLTVLIIKTDIPTFGSQPYLTFKTKEGSYYHDNFDFQKPYHEWSYVFDKNTYQINNIEKIGIAANNAYGVTSVSTLNPESGKINNAYYNEE
jgi:hypothetical protein